MTNKKKNVTEFCFKLKQPKKTEALKNVALLMIL